MQTDFVKDFCPYLKSNENTLKNCKQLSKYQEITISVGV